MTAQPPEARLTAAAGGARPVLERLLSEPAGDALDPRSAALVRIAALIALDAPPASYAWHVASAIEAGVEPGEIVGVLNEIGPEVGSLKVVAAAPEIMLALGMTLPGEAE